MSFFTVSDIHKNINNNNEVTISNTCSLNNFYLNNDILNNNTNSMDNRHINKKVKMIDKNDSEQHKKPPNGLSDWLSTFQKWSHNERLVALESLVTKEICEIQQLRHLISIIEPQLQRDFISLLPKELSLYVLSFLDPPDLLRAAQTCHYWRILCEDNLLWREKCREEGLLEDVPIPDIFKYRKKLFSKKFDRDIYKNELPKSDENEQISETTNTTSKVEISSDNIKRPVLTLNIPFFKYKKVYLHQKNIEYNWRYGLLDNVSNSPTENNDFEDIDEDSQNSPILTPTTPTGSTQNLPRKLNKILHLKGHEDHVITCLQFNPLSNLIVSGSDDNTLKVWCSLSGRCLLTLTGHTGGVWSSQLSPNNIVISGSTDRTLRVWSAITGQCIHVLYGHTSTVRCMALHGTKVVSGSRDATLRVWDIDTGQCISVLVGHIAAVRCVQFNGKLCVSGAYDYLLKVWDVSTQTCLHTLEGHTNRVYSLQFDGRHIVSGSLDTSIRVWCAESGRLKHTLMGHQSLTSGMQLRNNILVSGNADSTIRVWDINTGRCLQTLSGDNKHQSAVTCLQFNSKFVITSSDDGTVKLWDMKTGQFIRNLVTLTSGGSGGVVWRIRSSNTKLVCAVGSRNGTEETKLLVLDFAKPNSHLYPEIENTYDSKRGNVKVYSMPGKNPLETIHQLRIKRPRQLHISKDEYTEIAAKKLSTAVYSLLSTNNSKQSSSAAGIAEVARLKLRKEMLIKDDDMSSSDSDTVNNL